MSICAGLARPALQIFIAVSKSSTENPLLLFRSPDALGLCEVDSVPVADDVVQPVVDAVIIVAAAAMPALAILHFELLGITNPPELRQGMGESGDAQIRWVNSLGLAEVLFVGLFGMLNGSVGHYEQVIVIVDCVPNTCA
jgi:hypothetical protein